MNTCPIDYATNSIFKHKSNHHEVNDKMQLVCIAKTVWDEVLILECKRTTLAWPKGGKKMVQVSVYQIKHF